MTTKTLLSFSSKVHYTPSCCMTEQEKDVALRQCRQKLNKCVKRSVGHGNGNEVFVTVTSSIIQ